MREFDLGDDVRTSGKTDRTAAAILLRRDEGDRCRSSLCRDDRLSSWSEMTLQSSLAASLPDSWLSAEPLRSGVE